MTEFSIIKRFCQGIGKQHSQTTIGVGDDAAVINIPPNKELAISTDTMVEGVHFFPGTKPELIAHKLLAVNLSDMAAMGAEPKWATMTMTLPTADDVWLKKFSRTLHEQALHYGVQLIGGDTTQGNLNLSINIIGLLPTGKALTRRQAEPGHDVYVSNTLGDAALALRAIEGNVSINDGDLVLLKKALDSPIPQVDLGKELLPIASACLDVSDGLLADLKHVCEQSSVSMSLDVSKVPVSKIYQKYLNNKEITLDLAINGGDDYQLAFTADTQYRDDMQVLANKLSTPLVRIGKVVKQSTKAIQLFINEKPYSLKNRNDGYEHFNT